MCYNIFSGILVASRTFLKENYNDNSQMWHLMGLFKEKLKITISKGPISYFSLNSSLIGTLYGNWVYRIIRNDEGLELYIINAIETKPIPIP